MAGSPVTAYYRAPLTEVSAGAGLAYGYYNNFVKPLTSALGLAAEDETGLIWERGFPYESVWWKDVKLHIFLPERLEQANRRAVATITNKLTPLRLSPPAGEDPRKIFSFAFPSQKGCGEMTAYPWTWLEQQEFERFRVVFTRLRNGGDTSDVLDLLRRYTEVEKTFDIGDRVEALHWSF